MAITTTWGVVTLVHEIATGKVTTVHWTTNAVDTALNPQGQPYTASAYGSQDVDGDVVIPYSNLTPEICIGWVKDAMGPEAVAALEQSLVDNINLQKNPVSESGVPW